MKRNTNKEKHVLSTNTKGNLDHMRPGFPGVILSYVTVWKKEKFPGGLSDVGIYVSQA